MLRRLPIHRLLRFSLGTLLWITLCTCGYFGAFRAGQLAADRDKFNELPTVRVYDVSDVMNGLAGPVRDRTYRELCAHLRAALPSELWTGTCGVFPFGATHAVAVLQRGPAHDHIRDALASFRRSRGEIIARIK